MTPPPVEAGRFNLFLVSVPLTLTNDQILALRLFCLRSYCKRDAYICLG